MRDCSNCDRQLTTWQLRCEVCGKYNWHAPQISVVIFCALAFAGVVLIVLDNMAATAANSAPEAPAATPQSPMSDAERFKGRRRVRGTSVGRPE